LDPVAQGAVVIAEMERARGPHAGQDAARLGVGAHERATFSPAACAAGDRNGSGAVGRGLRLGTLLLEETWLRKAARIIAEGAASAGRRRTSEALNCRAAPSGSEARLSAARRLRVSSGEIDTREP